MSTSASALSSAASYFPGMSSYSQDLNNSISREVQIASLPIQLLQNTVTDLSNDSGEYQKLSSDFSAVQSAISQLASASSASLQSAMVSASNVANATAGSSAISASYSLEVDNLGSPSGGLSLDTLPKITDPSKQSISTSVAYSLKVNGVTTTLPLLSASGNNLNALAADINSAAAGVEATVVNVGSDTTPDYRLSLQSNELSNIGIQLNDGSQDLLTDTAGTSVQYSLNGTPVTSGSRTVTLATGLTATLTGTNVGSPTTVTVAPNTAGIGQALQSFVSAYNSAITELNQNRGQAGGALSGQSIIYQLTDSLQSLANYATGSGNISSLAALGVTFDDTTGQLSYNSGIFTSASSGQLAALTQFLGSATSGGFVQTATDTMTGIMDPTSGSLTQALNATLADITSTNQQISDQTDAVNVLQQNLTQQMSAADAMIASLQQQATYFNDMFSAMQVATNSMSSMASNSSGG